MIIQVSKASRGPGISQNLPGKVREFRGQQRVGTLLSCKAKNSVIQPIKNGGVKLCGNVVVVHKVGNYVIEGDMK